MLVTLGGAGLFFHRGYLLSAAERDDLGVGQELIRHWLLVVLLQQVLDNGRVTSLRWRLGQSVVDLLVQDDNAPVLAHAVVLRWRPGCDRFLAHGPVQVLRLFHQLGVGARVLLADHLRRLAESLQVLELAVARDQVDTLVQTLIQLTTPLLGVLGAFESRL